MRNQEKPFRIWNKLSLVRAQAQLHKKMLTLNVTNRIVIKITVWLIPTRQRFDNCLLKKFNYTLGKQNWIFNTSTSSFTFQVYCGLHFQFRLAHYYSWITLYVLCIRYFDATIFVFIFIIDTVDLSGSSFCIYISHKNRLKQFLHVLCDCEFSKATEYGRSGF
jgi:hypothetical protein